MANGMKIGDTVYGINQPGMVGEGVVIGTVHRINVAGFSYASEESHLCHELYTGPEDRSKSNSIFDYRLFNIEDVYEIHEEAKKRYFVMALTGD